jgi:DnaJ-class molecular chaperone
MTSSSLSLDYYKILQLPKNCLQEDIAESFRNLSLKYHPKVCSPENSAKSEFHFQKLCEAYEVLSDPIKKEIYDIYGQEGLKNGIIDKKGNIKGGYIYSGNGHEIFEKFMGTANPFTLKGESEKGFFDEQICENKKNEEGLQPIDVDLECTLEELYNGCVKHIKYKRRVIGVDFRTTEEKEAAVDVEIFRGYDKHTVIPYKGMGNQSPGMKNSDLIVHIKEKKHKCFQRVNTNDLIYVHKIDLAQALNSEPVKFTTLDGRKLAISIDEIISPSTVKVVPGEGMPIFQNEMNVRDLNIRKGDLYIKFDIKFPEYIDPAKKIEITSLLEREES